jgi:hypothetical protein
VVRRVSAPTGGVARGVLQSPEMTAESGRIATNLCRLHIAEFASHSMPLVDSGSIADC